MKVKTNLAGGILFLLFGLVILILVPFQIKASQTLTVGNDPRLMPRIVAIIIMICSAGLILKSLIFKKETIVEIFLPDIKNALYTSIIMLGFLFCIIVFGFFIASILMIIVFLLFFKERKPLPYIILSALSVVVYFLFAGIFHVPLAGGILFK